MADVLAVQGTAEYGYPWQELERVWEMLERSLTALEVITAQLVDEESRDTATVADLRRHLRQARTLLGPLPPRLRRRIAREWKTYRNTRSVA